jgi:hypothetical protein
VRGTASREKVSPQVSGPQAGLPPSRRYQDGGIRHGDIQIDVYLGVPVEAHLTRNPSVIPDQKGVAFHDLYLRERARRICALIELGKVSMHADLVGGAKGRAIGRDWRHTPSGTIRHDVLHVGSGHEHKVAERSTAD